MESPTSGSPWGATGYTSVTWVPESSTIPTGHLWKRSHQPLLEVPEWFTGYTSVT